MDAIILRISFFVFALFFLLQMVFRFFRPTWAFQAIVCLSLLGIGFDVWISKTWGLEAVVLSVFIFILWVCLYVLCIFKVFKNSIFVRTLILKNFKNGKTSQEISEGIA